MAVVAGPLYGILPPEQLLIVVGKTNPGLVVGEHPPEHVVEVIVGRDSGLVVEDHFGIDSR